MAVNGKKELTIQEKEKQKMLQEEADRLLTKVTESNLNTLLEKVGWILNHYPQTRDSDICCQIKFWETFEPEHLRGNSVSFDDLHKTTRLTSITRARAKIQNEYRLFLASNEVQKHRGKLQEEEREWSLATKPGYPIYTVFLDESGKTNKYLIVGSLWILDHMSNLHIFQEVNKLKEDLKVAYEFHYKNLSNHKLSYYDGILKIIAKYSATISFKAISVERAGNKNINNTLSLMMSYLLIDGIEHENSTGRAPLPRTLQVIKDKEESGSDKIMLREIRNNLEIKKNTKYKEELFLDTFNAIDSKNQIFLQITDLFTSSINRKLNINKEGSHVKDVYAKIFLNTFGVDIERGVITTVGDLSKIMDV